MAENTVPEAWVQLPSEEELRASSPEMSGHPYDFGFLAPMSRLIRTHGRIGAAFGALFAQIMFVPGHLDRAEREMVAGVAAAAQDCRY